jgi:cellulose biosynthesis protein BcsQ
MSNSSLNFVPVDQAQGLRQLMGSRSMHQASVVGFVSHSKARGQVSQQIDVLVSIASSLCASGHSVLVVDADRLLIGARLGLRLRYELADWVDGECSLNEVVQQSASGLSVISAAKAFSRDDVVQSYRHTAHSGIGALLRIVEGQVPESSQKYDFVFIVGSANVLRLLAKQALHSLWLVTTTQNTSIYGAAQSAASLSPHLGAQSLRIVYSDAADAQDCETAHVTLVQLVEQLNGKPNSSSMYLQFAGAIEAKSIDNQSRTQQMIRQIASTMAKCRPFHSSHSSFSVAL